MQPVEQVRIRGFNGLNWTLDPQLNVPAVLGVIHTGQTKDLDVFEVALNRASQLAGGKKVVEIHHGRYSAQVDPKRFVDVIVDRPDIQLALITRHGQVVGALNNPHIALFQRVSQGAADVLGQGGVHGVAPLGKNRYAQV